MPKKRNFTTVDDPFNKGGEPPMQGGQLKGILLAIIVFAMISLISASYYTITSGTVGILATFGKYNKKVKKPGLHFKMPVMQHITIFDIKLHTANYQGNNESAGVGVINRGIIEVLDNKNLPIGIEMSVQFIPNIEDASLILSKYGYNYFDKLINPMVRNIVRDVIGDYHAEEIANQRSKIGAAIKAKINEGFLTLPFSLHNIALRDIKLPGIVLNKVKEVQLAKQEEQRLAMVEKQAMKEQKIKEIQAKTRLIEITTQALANAKKQRIGAEARAFQIEKEAKAEAAANIMIGKSISPGLIRYRSIERWDGRYPKLLMSGKNESMILNLPEITPEADRK